MRLSGEAIGFVETPYFRYCQKAFWFQEMGSLQRVRVFLLTFIRSENMGFFLLLARLISLIALYIDVHFFPVDTG